MQHGRPDNSAGGSGAPAAPVSSRREPAAGAFVSLVSRFLKTIRGRVALVSALLVLPCFWHRHIAAGDLGSHIYNAWLCDQIRAGKAPGLTIANQWNNVLFDWLLDGLAHTVGFGAAEKLAVAIAVLIFFWGAFAWVWAASGRRAFFLLPLLAMLAYGWTFHAGFFNYYLALGFSFWGLAIFWRAPGGLKWLALPFFPLAYLAHPLGLLWLGGATVYLAIARRVALRGQIVLLALAGAVLASVRLYVRHERFFIVKQYFPAALINGADQLVLGTRYYAIALAVLLIVLGAVVTAWREWRRGWRPLAVPLQLYVLTLFVIWTQPTVIHLPRFSSPVGFILERVSLISAVVACGVIGGVEFRRWQKIALAVAAGFFFGFVYDDTARLNRIEARAEALVRTVPLESRVLASFDPVEPGSRLQFNMHLIDRACVGRAFSYANYEASTSQFRVRAQGRNRVVLVASPDIAAALAGDYVVREEEEPIFQIFQRSADPADLEIRILAAGEKNGRVGFHAP